MALTKAQIEECAKIMDGAFLEKREVERLTKNFPELSHEESYKIQDTLAKFSKLRGESIVGFKMGLTSKAKMEQMGVKTPIVGYLTNTMELEDGGKISLGSYIHPKVEPEIAFFIGKELKEKTSHQEVLESSEWICPALEIIDSRYTKFSFTLADVVADNCSSSAFVLGKEKKSPSSVNFFEIPMNLMKNVSVLQKGSSSAIYGNPVDSVIELVHILSLQGKALPAGSIVLAGAATAAAPLEKGNTYSLDAPSLGSVSIRVI